MCRRCVQECVKQQGGKGKDLKDQINDLARRQVIAPQLKDWAHHVRILGNAGAHPDVFIDVQEADAREAVDFAGELLKYIYVLAARYERRTSEPNTPRQGAVTDGHQEK